MTAHLDTLQKLRAGRLAGATQLDLRNFDLEEFPPEIFELADTLQSLDLSGNRLRALPDDLPRLRELRTLFCSNNPFTALPAVLGRCERLDLVGFKANAIEHVPAESLPERLRWLILSDNRVESLPATLGQRPLLQKLALAGNRLSALPDLARCERLELVRLSANRFARIEDALPEGLLALPNLMWIAYAGNPFNLAQEERAMERSPIRHFAWDALRVRELLGTGASGFIHRADGPDGPVAVKLFKGTVTSDGLPASEMAASVAAGRHANLVGVEGRIDGHPQGTQALVLGLIPPHYRNLAGPPSLATCTRDRYADDARFTPAQASAIAQGAGDALAHLHARGLVHGDFYAHNLMVDDAGHALLGDFGAASFLPEGDAARREALLRIDRRAHAVLVEELARCTQTPR